MKEKANKTSAAPYKVKGAVLFTVVCVMMVLIVFLMGTLALAATANKRAMTNYQQEQTEYTARAVLNAVLQNINNDPAGQLKTDIANIGTTGTLTVQVEIPGDNAQVNNNVIISDTGTTQTVYKDGQWENIPVYRMEVTVASQTTAASTTYEALICAMNAVPPTTTITTITTGGGGGGAFVSLGDVSTDIGTGGYITGGTYIGLDNKDAVPPIMQNYTVGVSADTMMDTPIYVYGNLNSANHRYTVHFTQPGDFFAVEGNFSVTHDTGFGTVYDGFSWDGSLATQSYDEVPKIYVGGTFDMNGTPVRIGSDDVPTNVFCGNFLFTCTNDSNLENIHGDIYAFDPDGTSELSSINQNHTELYAWASSTISVKDENNVDKYFGEILSAGNVNLHTTADGQILAIGGSIRVDKNVTIDGGKTCKVGSTVGGRNVKGDVVVGGTLMIAAGTTLECTGDVICGNLVNKGTIKCDGTIKAVNHAMDGDLDGKTVTEITAPSLGSSDTITTYYEVLDVSAPLDYGDWHIQAHYNKHQSVNGGAETVTEIQMYESAGDFVVSKADCPDSADLHNYLMANSSLYSDIMTFNNVKTETTVNKFYDFQAEYGKDVYPDKYAKTKDVGGTLVSNMPEALFTSIDTTTTPPTEVITIPKSSDYTSQYITTIAGLGPAIYQDGGQLKDTNGNVLVEDYHGYAPSVKVYGGTPKYAMPPSTTPENLSALLKTDVNNDVNNKEYYEVTSSCVLSGNIPKNLYIKTANGATPTPITVVLDNVTMEKNNRASIIVDDSAQVTLFVIGTLNCGTLITEDYLNLTMGAANYKLGDNVTEAFKHMTGDLEINQVVTGESDPFYPNVLIYGENNSTDPANPTALKLRDTKEMITAIVRAPYMDFYQKQTAEVNKTVKYHPTGGTGTIQYGASASYAECGSIGVIGELIAKQIHMDNAGKWGLIYVTLPGASGPGGSRRPTTTHTVTTTTGGSSEYFDFMYFNVA